MSERIHHCDGGGADRLFVARIADSAIRRFVLPRIGTSVLVACAGLVAAPIVGGVGALHEPGTGQLLLVTAGVLIAALAVALLAHAARFWRTRAAADPVVIDATGVSLPFGGSTVFLPWAALRSVTARRTGTEAVLSFRTRPQATPREPGARGVRGRWFRSLAGGQGVPLDTRLLDTTPAELAAAIEALSDGRVHVVWT